jgi:hypothetical protein
MKKIMFALMLTLVYCMSTAFAFGASYTEDLDWNDNTETDLAGYNAYELVTDNGDISDDIKLNPTALIPGSFLQVTGTVPDNAVTEVCWVVTAVDTSDNESAPSDKACYTFDTLDTTPPAPPTGLIATLVELIVAVIQWLKNFFA